MLRYLILNVPLFHIVLVAVALVASAIVAISLFNVALFYYFTIIDVVSFKCYITLIFH